MADQQTADAAVSLPDDIGSLIQMGYEKADREYMQTGEVDLMSEDELRAFLTKPKEDETQQVQQTVTEQPQQTSTVQPGTGEQPSGTSAQQTPAQETAPVPNPEIEALTKRVNDLLKLTGEQANELGKYRQYQPYLDPLESDPRFRQHVTNYWNPSQQAPVQQQGQQPPGIPDNYDPYNPAHVQQMINSQVQAGIQAYQQQQAEAARRAQVTNMMQTFQRNLAAEQQRLIASGADPVKVNTAVQAMSQMLMNGTFVEAAVKYHDMQSMIAEAEARGRSTAQAEFQRQLSEAAQTPVRTAGAGARQSGNNNAAAQGAEPKTPQECETPEQLLTLMDRMLPLSENWLKAAEYGAGKGWAQFQMTGGQKDYR